MDHEEFENFPKLVSVCEAIIPSADLRDMVQELEGSESKQVWIAVNEGNMSVIVEDQKWTFDFDDMKSAGLKHRSLIGLGPGQTKQEAMLCWPYHESLRKASYLACGVAVCFVTDPRLSVLLFTLQELSGLIFIEQISTRPLTIVPYGKRSRPNNFSFEVKPARQLKYGIDALSDYNFNNTRMGVIEIGPHGMCITAGDSETHIFGCLQFQELGLINFQYQKPLYKMKVDLVRFSDLLRAASDEDSITFYQVYGSNELIFTFGGAARKRHALQLLENDRVGNFPPYTIARSACLSPCSLRGIIRHLEAYRSEKDDTVHLLLAETRMSIFVNGEALMYDYEEGGISRAKPGEIVCCSFRWPHYSSLLIASHVAEKVILGAVEEAGLLFHFDIESPLKKYLKFFIGAGASERFGVVVLNEKFFCRS